MCGDCGGVWCYVVGRVFGFECIDVCYFVWYGCWLCVGVLVLVDVRGNLVCVLYIVVCGCDFLWCLVDVGVDL